MRRTGAFLLSAVALAACEPEIPDSAAGVGFDNYQAYQAQRQAELAGQPPVPQGPVIASETADRVTVPAGVTTTTTTAAASATSASEPADPLNLNNSSISDEQNFDAVSSRESIESDAARIAANREAYVVIQPTALPTRPADGRPNIVAYALATNNPVGEPLYRRSGTSQSQFQRACARFPSSDLAQEEFLARGGPERDRLGVDPDGDGYACFWDPTPFRSARGG